MRRGQTTEPAIPVLATRLLHGRAEDCARPIARSGNSRTVTGGGMTRPLRGGARNSTSYLHAVVESFPADQHGVWTGPTDALHT
jgi:hypothetical protein